MTMLIAVDQLPHVFVGYDTFVSLRLNTVDLLLFY